MKAHCVSSNRRLRKRTLVNPIFYPSIKPGQSPVAQAGSFEVEKTALSIHEHCAQESSEHVFANTGHTVCFLSGSPGKSGRRRRVLAQLAADVRISPPKTSQVKRLQGQSITFHLVEQPTHEAVRHCGGHYASRFPALAQFPNLRPLVLGHHSLALQQQLVLGTPAQLSGLDQARI